MNWARLKCCPCIDTRAGFVAGLPRNGTLLDLGSSDGETLGHIRELRPDLLLYSVDLEGQPEAYPPGTQFQRANLESEKLSWPDASMDGITCMHLVEHLRTLDPLVREAQRLLKPGALIYIETPHPKTVDLPRASTKGDITFTLNFFDDPTHIRPVTVEALEAALRTAGLEVVRTGISRNWLFAAAWPIYRFMPTSRQKFTSMVHWIGWSAFVIARKPS